MHISKIVIKHFRLLDSVTLSLENADSSSQCITSTTA